jgi:hypothetical protein
MCTTPSHNVYYIILCVHFTIWARLLMNHLQLVGHMRAYLDEKNFMVHPSSPLDVNQNVFLGQRKNRKGNKKSL